jgi:60 kDa SS-A/Ro ribonucleoprotein
MANKQLFQKRGESRQVPKTDTRNAAGGRAYKFEDRHALAQFVVTGTFSNTYYTTAGEQLKQIEGLVAKCDSPFLAKLAVYGRQEAKMKDTPAYLLAVLHSRRETALVAHIFDRVCDNSKMLFNFIQIVRSGATGRRNLGTSVKNMIRNWIARKSPKGLYLASLGHSKPSMSDVIRMVHIKPTTAKRQAIYKYLTGLQREGGINPLFEDLPEELQIFEALKKGETKVIPDIPFRALTNCELSVAQWKQIGLNMPWNTLRMNLNMLSRKGAFEGNAKTFTSEVVAKLSDAEEVRRCNAFPYQLLTTFQNVNGVPQSVKLALQDAMEIATENVPALPGQTVVAIDVSGSMGMNVTGSRRGVSSVTRCVDVASLVAACVLRNNPTAIVYAFDCENRYRYGSTSIRGKISGGLYDPQLNPRDSVMTNAGKLAKYGGGGTDCSIPLRYLNQEKIEVDNFIIVSDNESWSGYYGRGEGYMAAWQTLVRRCPKAKMVNIDIQPNHSSQSPNKRKEILNIGGFSDTVFTVMDEFFNRDSDANFVDIVEQSVE